jgi:hypothetical protein
MERGTFRREAWGIEELAQIFGVTRQTVWRWRKNGWLSELTLRPTRFSRQGVENFMRDRGQIGPDENLPDNWGEEIDVEVVEVEVVEVEEYEKEE